MLTPFDAGDNNESNGIKMSFLPKIGITIVVVHDSDEVWNICPWRQQLKEAV